MNIIRKFRIWVLDKRLKFLRKKIKSLFNESIKVHSDDLKLVCRSTFAVINGQPVNKKQYEENDQRIAFISQQIARYMKKELQLTYRYFELIGKPIRQAHTLKLVT